MTTAREKPPSEPRLIPGDVCRARFLDPGFSCGDGEGDGMIVYAARTAPGEPLVFTCEPNGRHGWGIGAFRELTRIGAYRPHRHNDHVRRRAAQGSRERQLDARS